MKLFDVYPLQPVELVKGRGTRVYDSDGNEYLDLYGGHAVISIGHSHPHYIDRISDQLHKIGYYSNSVINSLQEELAALLGKISGYQDHQLLLINSGAEANENAVKIAAFHNPKPRLIAFRKSFHGRTSRMLSLTDNQKYRSPLDNYDNVTFLEMNDTGALQRELAKNDVCAVIIEGIQGLGGIHLPGDDFMQSVRELCDRHEAVLILDEIQSGYGRSGKFFAHQHFNVKADIITMAKGMGNGFPVAGVLISPEIEPWYGMAGTTFGGNHLACAAALAVLEVMEQEDLIIHSQRLGDRWMDSLREIPGVLEVRGKGLMIGLQFAEPVKSLRGELFSTHHILTGVSSDPNVLRLLPPMCLSHEDAERFVTCLEEALKTTNEKLHATG